MIRAALDTSGRRAGFCVVKDGRLLVDLQGEVVGRASAELMPFILGALKDLDLDLRQIVEWRVGLGPGSFSGIRSGAALVAGVARGTGAGVGGVASSFAMAAAVAGEVVDVLHDGRRGEVIHSSYRRDTPDSLPILNREPAAIAIDELSVEASRSKFVMLADDPALASVEARFGVVETVASVPTRFLLHAKGGGALEPVYVRPAVFVAPRSVRPA